MLAGLINKKYNVLMKIDVLRIAKLADLSLKKEEVAKFEKQLSSVLDYIKKLNETDTKNVKETSQVTGLENITGNDKTSPSLSREEALSGTRNQHNGMFKLKAILE